MLWSLLSSRMTSMSVDIFVFTFVSRTSQAENVSLELKLGREAQH